MVKIFMELSLYINIVFCILIGTPGLMVAKYKDKADNLGSKVYTTISVKF